MKSSSWHYFHPERHNYETRVSFLCCCWLPKCIFYCRKPDIFCLQISTKHVRYHLARNTFNTLPEKQRDYTVLCSIDLVIMLRNTWKMCYKFFVSHSTSCTTWTRCCPFCSTFLRNKHSEHLSLFAGTFMVVWKKEATLISAGSTKVIRDSRLTVVGTSLDIGKVTSKDSGNYTCEINTDVPSHVNIVLNVLGELFSRSNDARARYIFPFSSAKSGKLKQNSKLYTQRRSCINIRQSPTNIILNLPLRIM